MRLVREQLTLEDFTRSETPEDAPIESVSVESAELYSVRVETSSSRKYLIVLQGLGQGEYLLRQILEIDLIENQFNERTFDESAIEEIKPKLRGIVSSDLLLTWSDITPEGLLSQKTKRGAQEEARERQPHTRRGEASGWARTHPDHKEERRKKKEERE